MARSTKATKSVKVSRLTEMKQQESAVFAELDKLGNRFGKEALRTLGNRYFSRQRDEVRLRREIKAREAELEALRQKQKP